MFCPEVALHAVTTVIVLYVCRYVHLELPESIRLTLFTRICTGQPRLEDASAVCNAAPVLGNSPRLHNAARIFLSK